MSNVAISTKRLDLVLESTEVVLARIDVMPAADRAEVSPDWLARLRAAPASDPWTHGFALIERSTGATVGSCGYRGPPGPDGRVEIAYRVEPDREGRGYATEAAEALVNFAFGADAVRVVYAHTRPVHNASARVLTKCGFERIGEIMDPEDGLVWRWERCRASRPED
jgi:RimJ/RimL family protein N-acetyltransferase